MFANTIPDPSKTGARKSLTDVLRKMSFLPKKFNFWFVKRIKCCLIS